MAILTKDKGERIIAALNQMADEKETAINKDNYFDDNIRAQTVKAVHMVKDTSVRALTNTLDRSLLPSDEPLAKNPDRWFELAQDAEKALKEIAGYAKDADVNTIIQETVNKTAQDVKDKGKEALQNIADIIPWQLYVTIGAIVIGGVGLLAYMYMPKKAAA